MTYRLNTNWSCFAMAAPAQRPIVHDGDAGALIDSYWSIDVVDTRAVLRSYCWSMVHGRPMCCAPMSTMTWTMTMKTMIHCRSAMCIARRVSEPMILAARQVSPFLLASPGGMSRKIRTFYSYTQTKKNRERMRERERNIENENIMFENSERIKFIIASYVGRSEHTCLCWSISVKWSLPITDHNTANNYFMCACGMRSYWTAVIDMITSDGCQALQCNHVKYCQVRFSSNTVL